LRVLNRLKVTSVIVHNIPDLRQFHRYLARSSWRLI